MNQKGQAPQNHLREAYSTALGLARQKLVSMDGAQIARCSGARYDDEHKCLYLRYLGEEYRIDCASGEIRCLGGESDAVLVEHQVLISHYLVMADATPLTGHLISFKELPGGGAIYCSNFQKRAIDPMVKRFANDFKSFQRAGVRLYGRRADLGHASVQIPLFPHVPVTYVIWQGDDEVPSSGTILFDGSIIQYMPVEDVVVAASNGTYAMMRLAKGTN